MSSLTDPARLHTLFATGLVEASAVARLPTLDRLARLAARATRAPLAQVNLVTNDTQVPAAAFVRDGAVGPAGVPLSQRDAAIGGAWRTAVGLDHSICQFVVTDDAPLVIDDTDSAERVRTNRAVTAGGVRAYAAVPLRAPSGHVLGTVCVVDFVPHHWTADDVATLEECVALASEEVAARLGAARALEEAQQTLDVLMEHIPEGITIASAPDVVVQRVSRYGRELSGASAAAGEGGEGVGHPELWEAPTSDGVRRAELGELPLTRATCTGEVVRGEEWVIRRPDGVPVTILCNAAPIRDASGAITGGLIAWRDIDDRKAREAALERLHAFGEALASTSTVGEVASTIAREARQVLGADAGMVFRVDPADPTTFETTAADGLPLGRWSAEWNRFPVDSPTPAADSARTMEPVRIPDRATLRARYPAVAANAEGAGLPCWLVLPCIIGSDAERRVVAVLGFGFRERLPPPFDARVATSIGHQAAQALERAFLFDAERGARAAAEARDAELRLAQAAANVGTWTLDLETGVVSWSPQYYLLHGLDPATDVPSRETWLASLHPDDRPMVAGVVPADVRQGDGTDRSTFSVEYRIVRPDGQVRWILGRGRVERDESTGRAIRLSGANLDITERREAEARVAASETQLRRVLDALFAFVGVLTPEGILLEANRAPLELAGLSIEDVRGRPFWEAPWWSYDAEVQRRLRDALARAAAGETVRYDVLVALGHEPDGRQRLVTIDFMVAPLFDDEGRVTHLVPSAVDVTERVEAVRAAEAANRAKADFLASMSHELRTPLNAIQGHVELVAMELHGPINSAQRVALDRVQRAQRHLLALITDILNFAKLESGKIEYDMRPVLIREVIGEMRGMIDPLVGAKSLQLTLEFPGEPVPVWADREKLAQVLLNLLSNAVKFTDRGGSVRVRVVLRRAPSLPLAGAAAEGAWVDVEVEDSGIGVPGDKLEVIFEPFVQIGRGGGRYTRAHEGSGLGLAISRDLARGMGGELTVRSVEGVGSTFVLSLRHAGEEEGAGGTGGAGGAGGAT